MHTYRKDLLNPPDQDLEADGEPRKTDSAWVQRQLWQLMLNTIITRNEAKTGNEARVPLSIHELMGNCLDGLYASMGGTSSSKNISVVLLAFGNLESMLGVDEELQLPFCQEGDGGGLLTIENEAM